MTIRDILDKFEAYDIKYDVKDNILFLYKPIEVKDFMFLIALVSITKEKPEIIVIDRYSNNIRKHYGGRL